MGHFELSFDTLTCPLHIHTFVPYVQRVRQLSVSVKGGMCHRLTFVDILADCFGLRCVGLVNDGFLMHVGGLQL